MIKIIITSKLSKEILEKFGRNKTLEIISLFENLERNPNKGKIIGKINNILIKEIRYKTHRFYFLIDRHKLKLFSIDEFTDLIVKFIRMSKKNDQDSVIREIKKVLEKLGFDDM